MTENIDQMNNGHFDGFFQIVVILVSFPTIMCDTKAALLMGLYFI